MRTRVIIADDESLIRMDLREMLTNLGYLVVGEAGDGRSTVNLARELRPDIVIMDMTMPELNGLDAAVQIKRRLPKTEILIFTGNASDQLIREVFEAGVKSFINKAETHKYLVDAIESLSRHKPFFTDNVSEVLFSNLLNRAEGNRDTAEPGHRLSGREREIVQLLAEGKSNKEVAEALGISVRTAETHRASILRKLNLDSVAGLVRYAVRNKIIEA